MTSFFSNDDGITVNTNRAPRNRTITLTDDERNELRKSLVIIGASGVPEALEGPLKNYLDQTINANLLNALPLLPDSFADLIIIDPPYNLTKDFNGNKFNSRTQEAYDQYLASWFPQVCKKLKPNGSLYLCGDWKCTSSLQRAMEKELTVLNRITWQREKGRGAKANWKNSMEDIWFGVKNADDYYFDVEAVKQKRRVIAPYKVDGKPKDWEETEQGSFRNTHPSNFWDDISVPYWSMPENTPHPTQKPEKLLAKLILASSSEGDLILDPFGGSGSTAVAAKKLGRHFISIEQNPQYCVWAQIRLERAENEKTIQGYTDGVFWERNTNAFQKKRRKG